MKVAVLSVAMAVCFNAWAVALAGPYKSGRQLYQENASKISRMQESNGQFIPVPIFYTNQSMGSTEIYIHFSKPYDPNLPTVIEFNGGPGASSHDPKLFNGYNVLNFDSRGVAFSRPLTRLLYLNTEFYSSENVARDAKEILSALGIEKVTVFGASYGSLAASIFARLFSENTQALVLSSPTSHLTDGVTEQAYLRDLVQKVLDDLDQDTRKFLTTMLASKDSEQNQIFIQIFRVAAELWLDQAHRRTVDLLRRASLSRDENSFYIILDQEMGYWFAEQKRQMEDPLIFDMEVLKVVKIKEQPFYRDSTTVFIKNGQAIIVSRQNQVTDVVPAHLQNQKVVSTFGAYDFKVPVFVFAGDHDVRTPSAATRIEYQRMSSPTKQMINLHKASHSLLSMKRSQQHKRTLVEEMMIDLMVRYSFAGEPIPESELVEVNRLQSGYVSIEPNARRVVPVPNPNGSQKSNETNQTNPTCLQDLS